MSMGLKKLSLSKCKYPSVRLTTIVLFLELFLLYQAVGSDGLFSMNKEFGTEGGVDNRVCL